MGEKHEEIQDDYIQDMLFDKDKMETSEEYEKIVKQYYSELLEEILDEYLVDGALLTCENATSDDQEIDGHIIHPRNDGTSYLRVTQQRKRIDDLPQATVKDNIKYGNITPFGNCKYLEEFKKSKEYNFCKRDILKNNEETFYKGTCNYFMNITSDWEMLPRDGNVCSTTDGMIELNMQSALFCSRGGAYIVPLTSGQRQTCFGLDYLADIDADELLTAFHCGLDFNQLIAFKEMKKYFNENPELLQGNVIFAFEGLGNYSNNGNKYHLKGQFGAALFICKDGKMVYVTADGSTLPDTTENAVIYDGIYSAVYWNHHGKYSTLQLKIKDNIQNSNIPALRYHGTGKTANGINVHMVRQIGDYTKLSIGCITIDYKQYYDFGVNAGFIEEQNDGRDYTNYDTLAKIYTDDSLVGQPWGYVVVDRKYIDENDKKVFFNNNE